MAEQEHGVLNGLSMAQVIAGALASVTSMLLTEQVGIAGGIIGVVVSSIAYTVTSKVYGNMLAKSGERLRDRLGSDSDTPQEAGAETSEASGRSESAVDPHARAAQRVAMDEREPIERAVSGSRIAPPALRAQAAGKRRAEMQRKVIVVSVVVALAAVAASALVVSLVTSGAGLGPKASQIATKAPATAAATTKAATTHAAAAATSASKAQTEPETQQAAQTDSSADQKGGSGSSASAEQPASPSTAASAAGQQGSQDSAASTSTAASPAAASTAAATAGAAK